ncbi:MAG: vanadium-dependent haloperoxidase [Gemmatimonadaceae bacterium]
MLGSQMTKGFALVAVGLLLAGCDRGTEAPLGPDPAAVAAPAARAEPGGGPNAVLTWNATAGEAALAACIAPTDDPLHESHLYATMHVAVHDALNAIDRRSRPYALAARIRGPASPEAAVAAAAREVLVTLIGQIPAPFPRACVEAGIASVQADYAAALGAIPDGAAKTEGLRIGRAAAAAILALRAGDGSDTPLLDFAYPQGTGPGEYRFTPGFSFVFGPGWADVTPFVLRKSSQFRPGPPYAVTSRRYAADFNEIKTLGGDGVTTPSARTADETEIALFWVESAPLQWNRIARTVAVQRGLDLWESARLFGLLNMALADGYVASFDTKRHYNFWRPVTAVRLADSDGNPNTEADPTWTPLVPTPPVTEYESAHAIEGSAAAQVLRRFFGTDRIRFTTCSLTLPAGSRCSDESPVLRSYRSFSQAGEENGLSRILVGFHFRKAVEEGIARGRKIGDYAVDRFLRPVGGP